MTPLTSLGILAALVTSGGGGPFWLPRPASKTAGPVDFVFNSVTYIALFFFLLIAVLLIAFVIRYRRREGHREQASATHNTALEITWSVIPLLIVIWIFWQGFKGALYLATPPQNAYEVLVTGQKWKWLFTYPTGYVDDNLHVPLDTPVRLVMTSEDVIHSFYVPEFRVKKDVVPGRYSKAWFHATHPGEYVIFCAEYCGTSHSDMMARVVVHPPGEFERWLEEASDFLSKLPPAEAGSKLYSQRGCLQCHSADGRPGTGPTFRGLFGSEHALADGSRVWVDEDYIRESIVDPQAKIVAGFEPVMPTYRGRLKDQEITAVIEYIKTLK